MNVLRAQYSHFCIIIELNRHIWYTGRCKNSVEPIPCGLFTPLSDLPSQPLFNKIVISEGPYEGITLEEHFNVHHPEYLL